MIKRHLSSTEGHVKNSLRYQFWAYLKFCLGPACLSVRALLVLAPFLWSEPVFAQNTERVRFFNTLVSRGTFCPASFLTDQAARPDNSALRMSRSVVDYIDERLLDYNKAVTAGMASGKQMLQAVPPPASVNEWLSRPNLFAEYNYIYSNDKRANGADSHTNSATACFSFYTKYDILLGLTYQYNGRDGDPSPLNFPDSENDNYFSLYLAKTFWQWVNVGVSGSYGYISTSRLGTDTGSEDAWILTPYVGVGHNWGAFSASLRTLYQYTWTNAYLQPGDAGDQTARVVVSLTLGYRLTEKLAVEGTAAYVGMTTYKPAPQNLPEARNWATFEAKATYALIGPLNVYLGFAYDAFNQSYNNYTAQGGYPSRGNGISRLLSLSLSLSPPSRTVARVKSGGNGR
jgi:hypothetical protein